MLMEEEGLTEHGEKLIAVLRGAKSEWVSRRFIAERLGRKKLYVWDTALLDRMASMGLIEAQQRPMPGAIGYEWQYRAIEGKE